MKVLRYCILLSIGLSFSARAQDQNKDDKQKAKPAYLVSAHLGSFLPNQIEGVTEILPMWGASYAFPSRGGFIEFGGMAASAHGVKYNNAYAEVRGDFPLEDLLVTGGLGVDAHLYTPPPSLTDPQPKTKASGGGHISGGINAHIADSLWFRVLMKFNISPGTSMYFGFGFEWRPPASEGTQDNP